MSLSQPTCWILEKKTTKKAASTRTMRPRPTSGLTKRAPAANATAMRPNMTKISLKRALMIAFGSAMRAVGSTPASTQLRQRGSPARDSFSPRRKSPHLRQGDGLRRRWAQKTTEMWSWNSSTAESATGRFWLREWGEPIVWRPIPGMMLSIL